MASKEPLTTLQREFSSEAETPTAWPEARAKLEDASIYWLTTVRPDGRPHVTPLFSIWLDDALYFCTGAEERKARNLQHNPHCVITTGCNDVAGLDLVLEGDASRVTDAATLQRAAAGWATKYDWHFTVGNGVFQSEGSEPREALVYAITPTTVFGFGKGDVFSQTRWRF